MPITVTISAETPKELRELLAGFSHSISEMNLTSTSSSVTASTTKKETKTKKEADQPQPLNQEEEEEEAAGTEDGNKEPTEDIPTVVDLRAKAQEVGTTAEAKKAIKALLEKFECKSISDVPEDKRTAFLAELEEI